MKLEPGKLEELLLLGCAGCAVSHEDCKTFAESCCEVCNHPSIQSITEQINAICGSGPDTYEALGPEMLSRLNEAEYAAARIREWVVLLSERGVIENLIARELCLFAGWAQLPTSFAIRSTPS